MTFAGYAALVAIAIVGGVFVLVFWLIARKERKAGQRAQALLESAYTVIERLKGENHKLRSQIETPSERQQSARDELAARGMRDEAPDDAA